MRSAATSVESARLEGMSEIPNPVDARDATEPEP